MIPNIIIIIFTGFGNTDKQWIEFSDEIKKIKNIKDVYIDSPP